MDPRNNPSPAPGPRVLAPLPAGGWVGWWRPVHWRQSVSPGGTRRARWRPIVGAPTEAVASRLLLDRRPPGSYDLTVLPSGIDPNDGTRSGHTVAVRRPGLGGAGEVVLVLPPDATADD